MANEMVKGVIGDTELSFRTNVVAPGETFKVPIKSGSTILRVREVFPDVPKQPRYTYDLLVGGRLVYRRDYVGTGFGTVSYFIYLPEWSRKFGTLVLSIRGLEPVKILDVQPVDALKLKNIEKDDTFGLLGLASLHRGIEPGRSRLDDLAANLPVKEGFYRGFSTEIAYAAQTPEKVAEYVELAFQWAKERKLALFLSPVSWWSGTPLRIEDGEGGKFGDVKYQQVCWSPEETNEENSELKALLGDRYNPHYCLSVPNQWSSTPWLTMNSPALNAYRQRRLGEAIRLVADHIKDSGVDFKGLYVENEPRYWDSACEASNRKRERKHKTLWADFNPLTVADAAKDGIKLDPADGLDDQERLWLVRNVTRYNQKAINWTAEALKKSSISPAPDIYTHSLQHNGFPGDTINHPMSEFAYAKGAYTGIEVMWSKLSNFDRIREWGPWANVNREENDGRHIGEHLWDLRVTYARGGKLYNSYNWQNIGSERFFGYVREFLDNLPLAEVKDPQVKQEGPRKISFATSISVQGVNRAKLKIKVNAPLPYAVIAYVKNPQGRVTGFSRVEGPFEAGEQEIDLIFSEPFELAQNERGTLEIVPEKGDQSTLQLTGASFLFDLRRERNQSLFIIGSCER